MIDVCCVKIVIFYRNWGWVGGGGGVNKLGGLVYFEKIIDWGGPNRLKWV